MRLAWVGRWKSRDVTGVFAMACTGCGLVTMHAEDLAALRADVADNPERYGLHS
ncbi:hypothetical protein ACFFMN_43280 [Planobispora siamensis]|uniref:Uncharacterized protein n=1 Tax=Planobispora siamensis TaxID=936338 RepID=A0A8J3SSK4_9ACTN|nr:hypothetical protein [Planobispora siamensis]GIH97629.1 hypothetical protein Psi01_82590 [Planobispora siamensis]